MVFVQDLFEEYRDDILAQGNTKRKYMMINNDDGTVSFVDVTDYTQVGDAFGANNINEITATINQLTRRPVLTMVEKEELQFKVDKLGIDSQIVTIDIPKGTDLILPVVFCDDNEPVVITSNLHGFINVGEGIQEQITFICNSKLVNESSGLSSVSATVIIIGISYGRP